MMGRKKKDPPEPEIRRIAFHESSLVGFLRSREDGTELPSNWKGDRELFWRLPDQVRYAMIVERGGSMSGPGKSRDKPFETFILTLRQDTYYKDSFYPSLEFKKREEVAHGALLTLEELHPSIIAIESAKYFDLAKEAEKDFDDSVKEIYGARRQ